MTATAFDRRTTPVRPDLAAAHLRGSVDAPRFVEGTRRSVTGPSTPLRREPRADYGIDTELLFGETFVVYDEDPEGWSWGQAERDGYVGWLPSLALGTADPLPPTHKVSTLRTFLYPGPSIKLPVVAALPFGARLTRQGEEGAFIRLAEGFVWGGHLVAADHVEADVVAVAETFFGVPYLWGGRSSLGLDCSGLVQTALEACGRPAPRDSDMQERDLGVPIAVDGPLQRGDLIFWRGHVAMMRDAATMLHANGQTMTVAIEDLAAARARILASGGGPVTGARRLM